MCKPPQIPPPALKLYQGETKQTLHNKELARAHLLKIQLLLAKAPLKS